jgi:hypothetical protein
LEKISRRGFLFAAPRASILLKADPCAEIRHAAER